MANTAPTGGSGPSTAEEFRRVVSDAYAFVRSAEVNSALATVTIEDLMAAQIQRNGESSKSQAAQYNPYSYDPEAPAPPGAAAPATLSPGVKTVGVGVSDPSRPTKLDRILAIQTNLDQVIAKIKATTVVEVSSSDDYAAGANMASVGVP